jgi:large subunit ribosomal protein L3
MAFKMGLLGRKLGMTQVFHEDGTALGCTVLELGPCTVTGQRTPEKHGYAAVQLGLGALSPKAARKSEVGSAKKAGMDQTPRYLREIRLDPAEVAKFEVGKVLKAADVFKAGDVVDAVGVTKGKGHQGVIKRWKMRGKPAAHGTHEFFRHGGSIGAGSSPGKVIKGMKMAGQHGNARVTTRNLEIVRVDPERNLLFVRGAIPGHNNALVKIRKAAKA